MPESDISDRCIQRCVASVLHALENRYALRRGYYWNILLQNTEVASVLHVGVAQEDSSDVKGRILVEGEIGRYAVRSGL
jgi:hypothetical protein